MINTLNAKIKELETRKKKFVFANVVAFILSVVAIASLIIFPLISLDLGVILGSAMKPSNGDEGASDSTVFEKILTESYGDADFKFDVTFFDSIRMINGEFNIGDIASGVYKEGGMIENILLYTNAANSLSKIVDFSTLSEDEINSLELKAIVDTIPENSSNLASAKANYVNKVVETAEALGFSEKDGDRANIESDFDEIIEKGTPEGGNYSLEYYVCTTLSDGQAKTYQELEEQMGGSTEQMEETASSTGSLQDMQGTFSIVGMAILGVVGLSILMWFLLALISFIKMFKENKCFRIWYVAFFAHFPFLIFFVAIKVLVKFLGESLGEATLIIGSITSMTWIMGICWGLIILLSFAFIIPKRKRIKRVTREIEELKIKVKEQAEKEATEIEEAKLSEDTSTPPQPAN